MIKRTCAAGRPSSHRRNRSYGLTLVEILVAMTLSLLLILGLTQVFQIMGRNVTTMRASMEMSGEIRSAAYRLQKDLEGVTVPVRPWPQVSSGLGYFELVEGVKSDWDANGNNVPDVGEPGTDSSLGDTDDYLAFTARTTDSPYFGHVTGTLTPLPNGSIRVDYDPVLRTSIQSRVAELVYWLELDDKNANGVRDYGENYKLYRRLLLVRPDLVFVGFPALAPYEFLNGNDVSTRFVGTAPVANSLADLTNRANRFAHNATGPGPGGFPFPIAEPQMPGSDHFWSHPDTTVMPEKLDITVNSEHRGEDVVLSHVIAFDLRVYDPLAQVRADASGSEALSPGDPGFIASPTQLGTGTYVDLFYSRQSGLGAAVSVFSGAPDPRSRLVAPLTRTAVYDTWSMDYERDGIDQNLNSLVDEAHDGLDNDNANGVDDMLERETSPPYAIGLRGIQIRIRIIENTTRQVRQMTVIQNFVPE